MNNWDWRTPIALTANQPIAHLVGNLTMANTLAFQPSDYLFTSFAGRHTIKVTTIDQLALTGIKVNNIIVINVFCAINNFNNWQTKLVGKIVIALVMSWNSHNSALTITGQYIIGDPNWHAVTGGGVDSVATGKDACLVVIALSLNFWFFNRLFTVFLDFSSIFISR